MTPKSSSVGNLQTEGIKKNNHPFQWNVLKALGAVISGVTPPGGLATEVTLQQVLQALQNGKEFEQSYVIDQGGVGCPADCPVYLQVRIWNTESHTFDPPVYYDASGAVVIPVGPLKFINPLDLLTLILSQITQLNSSFTGTLTSVVSVDISGNATYNVPSCYAWELIVISGTVTDGIIVFPQGTYPASAPLLKNLPAGTTLDATGATAYVRIMNL